MTLQRVFNRNARRIAAAVLISALATVAGCDTAEDRAEKHFQSAQELIAQGDDERALVELRNVFKLNAQHHEARLAFAKMLRERGAIAEAFREYRKAAEQAPDEVDTLIATAELAAEVGNLEELVRQTGRLMTLAPDSRLVQSLDTTIKYNQAITDKDEAARTAQVERAKKLIGEEPALFHANRIVLDDLLRAQDFTDALAHVDAALAIWPEDITLSQIKLGLFEQLGETDEMRSLLEDLVAKRPDDEALREALISFYVRENDIDGADALLKQASESSTELEPSRRYVAYLLKYRGADAAMAELERLIASGHQGVVVFQTLLARLKFDNGERDAAIVMLEDISAKGERTADIRNLEIELAQMLFQTGNAVGARQLVERVLQEDQSNPGASKIKAAWLIQDDNTDEAVVLLRNALSTSPRDFVLMTILAQAYQRQGNRELAMDMLAQAVEASNKAPDTSLRYANALVEREQAKAAEQVLIEALRLDRNNVDLLTAMGGLYATQGDWAQAEGVLRRLKEIGTEASNAVAAGLEVQILSGQEKKEELGELLQSLSTDPNVGDAARTALLRRKLETEGPEAALEQLDAEIAASPDDAELRFARAGVLVLLDRKEEAIPIYRKLIEDFPRSDRVWLTLYRIEMLQGNPDAARSILAEGLAALPRSPSLLMAKAEDLQTQNEWEQAIEVYEALYLSSSSSLIVANNLASLLADHRTDEDSLKQAYNVARRLRETDVPAFQDTYGWIAHRMGNVAEALPYLEGAAKGLANDPTVQYHYGASLAANGKTAEALEQLRKTEAMIDASNPPAFEAELKSEIERLSALPKE